MAKEKLPKNTTSNDEIDLGQLFQMIGNGLRKLFNFIGNIFKGFFHVIILILLFIKRHLVKLIITGIIGLILGFFIDYIKEPEYISMMVIEPNFNSAQQLYNNINFYNELADSKDSVGLSEALDISVKEAAEIKEMKIEAYVDENQKVQLFDRFIRSLDSTTQRAIDIKNYLENFNSIDARFHTITLIATNNTIAKKIQPTIINSISSNEYFKLQQNINDKNLDLQDSIYKKQLVEIDSLQRLYKRVMEKEAENPLQGTNINLGENGTDENKELALILQVDKFKESIVKINEERANKSSILNVISAFPRRGVEDDSLWNSYKFLTPLVFIGMVLLILGVSSLNNFLKEYGDK